MKEMSKLKEVENRLYGILQGEYQNAQGRNDLLAASLLMHKAIEDAINANFSEEEIRNKTFHERVSEALPEYTERLYRLHKRRSDLAHPEKFTDQQVRQTAEGLVDFLMLAWKDLFGPGSSPPVVRSPSLSRTAVPPIQPETTRGAVRTEPVITPVATGNRRHETLVNQESKQEEGQGSKPKHPAPWRSLVFGIVLLLPVPWLTGFTQQLWRNSPIAWYWLLALTAAVSILFFLALRRLWRFFRTIGLVRTIAGTSVLLVVATVALIPSTQPDPNQGSMAAAAVDRLLTSLERATLGATRRAFSRGQGAADVLFAERETEPVLEVQSRSTATPAMAPATTAVTATEIVEPTLTATPRPLPTPSIPLAVGMQVVVTTGGGRLNLRVEPSTSSDIVTPLEHGTELTIIGGPQAAEGFTWWEVEGAAGRGWSAGQYLAPISP